MMDYKNYLNDEGKIIAFPKKKSRRRPVLEYLVSQFEFNKIYTEKEVNSIIDQYHIFNDYFLLRRELIEYKLMCRTNNGAKYWRASLIPEMFETDRLRIRKTILEDETALLDAAESCAYMERYTGQPLEEGEIRNMILEGDLPPDGYQEFFQCMSIINKEDNQIIGYFNFYCGYPESETIWISVFSIHKSKQYQGYGKEVMDVFYEIVKNSPFKSVSLGVHLKNWQGLRFWVKCGFDKIKRIVGDKEYDENHFSVMALEKNI